ncbi:MAG: cell envelope integrity protein CreD [Deltaproteobacteria bacterium]|jgi:inner membrane protein|nr:cell envelope integrity protein CreD [Deltaproteobacteria bacterium]
MGKLGFITALSLVLALPLGYVQRLTEERDYRRQSVINNLDSEWGDSQILSGPYLAIPVTFTHGVTETVPVVTPPAESPAAGALRDDNAPSAGARNDGSAPANASDESSQTGSAASPVPPQVTAFKTVYREVSVTRLAVVAPTKWRIEGDVTSEERRRGIYKTQVYMADIKISGDFDLPDRGELAKLNPDRTLKTIDWAGARLVVGLSDTTAIRRVGRLSFGGQTLDMGPGNGDAGQLPGGFSAPVNLEGLPKSPSFSLDLGFGGSSYFRVAPIGKSTEIELTSNWPHPSFSGNGLPVERTVDSSGFSAKWTVPDLVHASPELFLTGISTQADDSWKHRYLVGVDFFEPVDGYRLIQRSTKFGILFVVLTFLILLVNDLGVGRRAGGTARGLHPLQYGIVGLALIMFYLVLLSLSEHLGFDLAYLLASAIIVSMIGGYAFAVTGSPKRGFWIGTLTALLYGVLYLILKQEDHALLSGTTLLLAVTVALMVLTRDANRPGLNKAQAGAGAGAGPKPGPQPQNPDPVVA